MSDQVKFPTPECSIMYMEHSRALKEATEGVVRAMAEIASLSKRNEDVQKTVCKKLDDLRQAFDIIHERLHAGDSEFIKMQHDIDKLNNDINEVAKMLRAHIREHEEAEEEAKRKAEEKDKEDTRFWNDNLKAPIVRYLLFGIMLLLFLGAQTWLQEQNSLKIAKSAAQAMLEVLKTENRIK